MQALRTISVTVALATMGVAVIGNHQADAQALFEADHPAEFPPASYNGTQYVDSRGCVYVRAGSEGSVQWVPRVSRDRKVLCGFKPTFANVEDALPVIPDAKPSETVAQALTPSVKQPVSDQTVAPKVQVTASTVAAPVGKPDAVTAKPDASPEPVELAQPPIEQLAGKTVGEQGCVASVTGGQLGCSTETVDYILKRLPAGVTVRTADGGRLTTTEPTLVRVPVKRAPAVVTAQVANSPVEAPLAPVVAANVPQKTVEPKASNQQLKAQCESYLGSASAQYMKTDGRYTVRCGPQAVHPSDYIQRRTSARVSTEAKTRVTVARAAGVDPYSLPQPVGIALPAGYSHAWTDGRLNPNRGPQTARGDLQMAQVLTRTTPAYDLYAPRKMTFWEWLFGPSVKTRKVVMAQADQDTVSVQLSTKSAAPSRTPVPVKSAVAQPQHSTAQSLRFVQVGTFGDPENAERSIARLSAMGYPVSSQILHRGGKSLKVVLAGPFGRPDQTQSALSAVRRAGYGDAFARK